jgi:hypothetical protein
MALPPLARRPPRLSLVLLVSDRPAHREVGRLVAAGLAALIAVGALAAAASEPPASPPAQSSVQQNEKSSIERIQRGRWQRNGRTFRHRQFRCRMIEGRRSCRWHYW